MPYLSVLEGGAHIILIFSRVAFIVLDMRPLAELNWLLFVVILRIVYGKFELFYKKKDPQTLDWTEHTWLIRQFCRNGMWQMEVGGGRGWWWGVLPWLLRAWACWDGTAHPLPFCLCSCVTHLCHMCHACNFPCTVTVWAHRHPGNF